MGIGEVDRHRHCTSYTLSLEPALEKRDKVATAVSAVCPLHLRSLQWIRSWVYLQFHIPATGCESLRFRVILIVSRVDNGVGKRWYSALIQRADNLVTRQEE